jgi:hypothetical protein
MCAESAVPRGKRTLGETGRIVDLSPLGLLDFVSVITDTAFDPEARLEVT